jgi:BirA family transcriptional regulator, biotin operon repressor / biotin---[acetyl-CoA-carboxylase] ligase
LAVRVEFDQVGSTQLEAVRLARSGSPTGTVVVARSQSAGVGRFVRNWSSPAGGLYLSMVVAGPSGAPALMSLAVAAELRRALGEISGATPRIKWPNDLVIGDVDGSPRKLSGVLLDRVLAPSGRSMVVVGVGVNVVRPESGVPPELAGRIVFLEDLARPTPALEEVERLVVRSVSGAVRRLEAPGGGAAVVSECQDHLFGVGRPVFVDGVRAGVLRSLCDDGAIQVEQDGAITKVYAGDLAVGAHA